MNVFGMMSLHSSLFVILVAVSFIWSNNNINQANAEGPEPQCKNIGFQCKSAGEPCTGAEECCSTVCKPVGGRGELCKQSRPGGCCNNAKDCLADGAPSCEDMTCVSASTAQDQQVTANGTD